MLVNKVALRAIQGDVFRFTVLAPWDLTGCSVACDIRDGDTLVEHLTSTPASGIMVGTYDAEAGTTLVTVKVGATKTALWNFGVARFDVEVTPPAGQDEAYKIARGSITLAAEVTHA